ncbi:MAG: caspase family protein, partial [Pyrinomonadaceae bacterium]|nr:caspase family protein [Pyrinomonadaceae bacterium]
AGQFRDVYYRPDVVSKVLETGDEARAVQLANEEAGRKQQQVDVAQLLPPVVEIVSPADGAETASSEIVVRFAVRTPSGEPVTEVKALVDGRPAATERGLSLPAAGTQIGTTRELRVIVPEGESQIAVVASNRFTTSVPATVRVRRARPTPALNTAATASAVRPAATAPATDAAFEIRPKLYVLAVGVSSYADPKLKLNFAAKDARDFASAWERQQGTLYREVVVKLLADDKATKDEVLDGLDWIRKETTSKDVAVILLAGHGVNDPTGSYYFLPHNADVERLLRTGVSFNDIKQTVATIAGKVLLLHRYLPLRQRPRLATSRHPRRPERCRQRTRQRRKRSRRLRRLDRQTILARKDGMEQRRVHARRRRKLRRTRRLRQVRQRQDYDQHARPLHLRARQGTDARPADADHREAEHHPRFSGGAEALREGRPEKIHPRTHTKQHEAKHTNVCVFVSYYFVWFVDDVLLSVLTLWASIKPCEFPMRPKCV